MRACGHNFTAWRDRNRDRRQFGAGTPTATVTEYHTGRDSYGNVRSLRVASTVLGVPMKKLIGCPNKKIPMKSSDGVTYSICASVVVGLALICRIACAAELDDVIRIDIPARTPLEEALIRWGSQVGMQVMFSTQGVEWKQTSHAVQGAFPARIALEKLLSDSGLSYRAADHTVTVVPSAPKMAEDSSSFRLAQGEPTSFVDGASAGSDAINAAESTDGSSETTSADQSDRRYEQVIVSAQKHDERLQDVPVPVTAIDANSLIESHDIRLQDFYTSVPGLSFAGASSQPVGAPMLVIRGISSGGGLNPTVGVVVDDVPFGSSTGLGWGYVVPDIDPSDLARVEVLRGPQGTLYGANSMGGLLKFVAVDPSTQSFTGRIQEDVSSVYNGAELGYGIRGSVNVPLSDTAAMRASVFARQDPGYIDNVQTGENGVNRATAYGGRASFLWRPLEEFSLKLSALLQRTETNGAPVADVEPGFGDLQQSYLRGTGGYHKEVQSYTATLTGKVGGADLVAISGYSINSLSSSTDVTALYGAALTEPKFGVTGTPYVNDIKNTKYTQEIRLSMPLGPRFDWLFGLFFTRENNDPVQRFLAEDNSTGQIDGLLEQAVFPTTYTEYAAFTDFTVHFTDQFDIQFGGRESENRQAYTSTLTGALVGSTPLVTPTEKITGNSFTYLVTPQFKFSTHLMAYVRLASGYQPGGPNPSAIGADLPYKYDASTTENYELGVKGDVLDQWLSFDASLYRINWKDIQVGLQSQGLQYNVNEGGARSQGIELSLQARPVHGLSISTWVTFNDAEITRAFPALSVAYAQSGDRLPDSNRFSANVSIQDDFVITNKVTGFVGSTESYTGNRLGDFQSTPIRQYYPAYAKLDAHMGINYDSWTMSLFVNNIADKRAVLNGGLDAVDPYSYLFIQPRTVGLSVSTTL